MSTGLADRVLTVPEAAKLLRISARSYYAAVHRGELPGRVIGRRIVVPGAQLARFLEGEVIGAAANNQVVDGGKDETGPRR